MRNFTVGMKSNPSNYIFIVFLTLLLSAFSSLNLTAGSKKINATIYSELTQKQAKSIHAPDGGFISSFENLFDNEAEDETEAKFNAALPVLNFSQNFIKVYFPVKSMASHSSDKSAKDIQPPLYLVTCSIKI